MICIKQTFIGFLKSFIFTKIIDILAFKSILYVFSVLSDFSYCFIFPVFLQITEYFIWFFTWATHESSQMLIYILKNPFH